MHYETVSRDITGTPILGVLGMNTIDGRLTGGDERPLCARQRIFLHTCVPRAALPLLGRAYRLIQLPLDSDVVKLRAQL